MAAAQPMPAPPWYIRPRNWAAMWEKASMASSSAIFLLPSLLCYQPLPLHLLCVGIRPLVHGVPQRRGARQHVIDHVADLLLHIILITGAVQHPGQQIR